MKLNGKFAHRKEHNEIKNKRLEYYETLGVNVKFISASIYVLRYRNIICLFFK